VLVAPRSGTAVSGVLVQLRRAGRTVATGRVSGRLAARTTAVRLEPTAGRAVAQGGYELKVIAKAAGCPRRSSRVRGWRFGTASLPVRGTLVSTKTGDNAGAVHLLLRSVGRRTVASVRARLLAADGTTVTEARRTAAFDGAAALDLPLAAPLAGGRYTLRLSGRRAGASATQVAEQPLAFSTGRADAAPASVEPTSGQRVQRAVVDWSGGNATGKDAAGFQLPGIGYGEVVCRLDAQYVRVYPNDLGREVSMLNWTYKDWDAGREKALREALHTRFTGPDFTEGLNKFSPPEKRSTGEYDAIVTDRGPIGSTGGPALSAPTSYRLTWVWDFSKAGDERCHVEVELVTEAPLEARPYARSAQVLWRGEADSPGRDGATIDLPGVGRMAVICRPGPDGVRRFDLDTPGGGAVTTREASEDPTVDFRTGPISAALPNNGMLVVRLAAGPTVVVSSRWKLNDPDPALNSCAIAAQALVP
jgi:hypothetical protein